MNTISESGAAVTTWSEKAVILIAKPARPASLTANRAMTLDQLKSAIEAGSAKSVSKATANALKLIGRDRL